MTQILIIEDEERIATFVAKGLKAAGYATLHARTAREGYDLAIGAEPELIVLDLGLPDEDGMSLLRRMRGSGVTAPVIVLTARKSLDDTVAALEGGADDYMAKPFGFDELLARVRLRLRSEASVDVSELTHGAVTLNLLTRRAVVGGKEVELSAREFTLAETFLRHPDAVLSREQLLSQVWGYDFDPGSNVVDVYVRYLRGKLGAERIQTVRGVGYRFVADS